MKKSLIVFLSVLAAAAIFAQSALAAPYEVYSRIEMNTADYYLDSAVDEFGNAVIFPAKTTFAEDPDAVSGATTLAKRFTISTDYGTNAKYAYNPDRAAVYLDWAAKITQITALSYDWAEIVRGVPFALQYEERDDGLILKTKDLTAGVYTVRIYSEGAGGGTFVFNLNVQKPAPVLSVKSNPISGQNASFDVKGMEFSWKSPVAEILLNGIPIDTEQYSLYPSSGLLTIAGAALTKAGENTLQLKLYGYYDTEVLSFTVQAAASQNMLYSWSGVDVTAASTSSKVDAVTSATTGGNGGDTDAVSGATGTVPAFLAFNFDMLSNALALEAHGMGTAETARVLKWWRDAAPEVVRGRNSMALYGWEDYVSSGKLFEEHIKTSPRASAADGLFWDMWEVKNVLETGNLGDPYDFYEQIAAQYPEITSIDANWNSGVTLTFGSVTPEEFTAWAAQIPVVESAEMHENGAAVRVDGTGLYKNQYGINTENQQLTLPKETLAAAVSEGSVLTIRSSGYRTISQKITFRTGSYIPKPAAIYFVGDSAEITGLPADITITGVNIQGSTDSIYQGSGSNGSKYFNVQVDGDGKKLVLSKGNFKEAGTYIIKLFSSNYAPQTVKVKLLDGAGKPIYQVGSISAVTFPQLTQGYEPNAVQEKSVSIQNTGNQTITNLRAALSGAGADGFVLGSLSGDLAVGESTALTITPKAGLTAGNYVATVTVTANNGVSSDFTVNQTVAAQDSGEGNGGSGIERPALPAGSYYIDEDVVITGFSGTGTGVQIDGKDIGSALYTSESNGTLTLKKGVFAKSGTYSVNLYVMMPILGKVVSISIVDAPASGGEAGSPGDSGGGQDSSGGEGHVAGDVVINDSRIDTNSYIAYIKVNNEVVPSSDYVRTEGTLTINSRHFPSSGVYTVIYYEYYGDYFTTTVTL